MQSRQRVNRGNGKSWVTRTQLIIEAFWADLEESILTGGEFNVDTQTSIMASRVDAGSDHQTTRRLIDKKEKFHNSLALKTSISE